MSSLSVHNTLEMGWSYRILIPFMKWIPRNSHRLLAKELLRVEKIEQLPRLFICSISYVFPHNISGLMPFEQEINALNDHKFIVIKHSNDHFQILQNYIDYSGNSSSIPRPSMNLNQWQSHKFNQFSSKSGFNIATMSAFLSYLFSFASESLFSSDNYYEMFGVNVAGGVGRNEYWPSVSYREIDDDVVHGNGHRCMANDLTNFGEKCNATQQITDSF